MLKILSEMVQEEIDAFILSVDREPTKLEVLSLINLISADLRKEEIGKIRINADDYEIPSSVSLETPKGEISIHELLQYLNHETVSCQLTCEGAECPEWVRVTAMELHSDDYIRINVWYSDLKSHGYEYVTHHTFIKRKDSDEKDYSE